jgi:hypothetical protein
MMVMFGRYDDLFFVFCSCRYFLLFVFVYRHQCNRMSSNLNAPENDPFYKKQPIRTRKKRLQESSRLGQKNLHPELEALPLLKGISLI